MPAGFVAGDLLIGFAQRRRRPQHPPVGVRPDPERGRAGHHPEWSGHVAAVTERSTFGLVHYADEFLVLLGGTRDQAEQLRSEIADGLVEQLQRLGR